MESWPREHPVRESRSMPAMPAPDAPADICSYRSVVAANDTRMSQLARTIEQEIIPRLMLAHRTAVEPLLRPGGLDYTITDADVARFAKLVVALDEDIASVTIRKLRELDVSVEKIFIDLLAPTARLLGTLWEEDRCSFSDVTVGLGRLQRVLRDLGPALGVGVPHPAGGRRVLLVPSPGEQHTFGLVMVGEFFRRAGWHVSGGSWSSGDEAATLASTEWFDVVGFSLAAEVHLDRLATGIAAVRQAACNRDIKVLVGGPLFGTHPEYADRVGADGMTIDGREAPTLAESLIARNLSAEVLPG